MNINATDLLVRLQLIQCCIGNLGDKLATELKRGDFCAKQTQDDLILLQSNFELLKYFQILQDEIVAQSFITIDSVSEGSLLIVYANGINISGNVSVGFTSEETALHIQTSVNSHQSTYIATVVSPLDTVVITGGCDDINLVVSVQSGTVVDVGIVTHGVCSVTDLDNCITDKQAQTLFDNISNKYGICFQPIGFSYST